MGAGGSRQDDEMGGSRQHDEMGGSRQHDASWLSAYNEYSEALKDPTFVCAQASEDFKAFRDSNYSFGKTNLLSKMCFGPQDECREINQEGQCNAANYCVWAEGECMLDMDAYSVPAACQKICDLNDRNFIQSKIYNDHFFSWATQESMKCSGEDISGGMTYATTEINGQKRLDPKIMEAFTAWRKKFCTVSEGCYSKDKHINLNKNEGNCDGDDEYWFEGSTLTAGCEDICKFEI